MNPKRIIMSLALISSMAPTVFAQDTVTCDSHMFVPRGASTDLTWINALTFYDIRIRDYADKKYFFNSMTIYQRGSKDPELGSAFLLGTSNTVSAVQGGGAGVINSLELGLANLAPATPFSGSLTINPEKKQFTYIGYMYADLGDWWCGLWGDFTFGVTNAHHLLNCCQTGTTLGTICPGIETISDALGGNTLGLEYSQFYCNTCADGKRRTGLEDVQLRLGYDYTWCDNNLVGLYLIGTIPSGRRPTAQYIFEPLVGSVHASFGAGLIADYTLDCFCGNDDASLVFMTDFNYRYVFKGQECRTFDLTNNGPMSRYILVVNELALGLPFPAANITTVPVNVQPSSTIQWWVAANYEVCNWDFELGYNLFWREQENLKTTEVSCLTIPTTVGVYNLNGCGVSPVTASTATMTSSGTADATFMPITAANFNLASGLAGRVLTNKIYGAVSWTGCACNCFEWMAGFGGSYEFASKQNRCNTLQNWAIFGKWAIGF